MKIIEAMKKIKANKAKIVDLQEKIKANSANLNFETPLYENPQAKIAEWAQSAEDTGQENIRLLVAIQRTNLATPVTIELGGKQVSKNIAEWVWRRRDYAKVDLGTWSMMTDRNLKEGQAQSSVGTVVDVKIVRHYNPQIRDDKKAMYSGEPSAIDAALEVTNAVTDLLE